MTGSWTCMLKTFDSVFMTKQESDLQMIPFVLWHEGRTWIKTKTYSALIIINKINHYHIQDKTAIMWFRLATPVYCSFQS